MSEMTYKDTGVDYEAMDPFKRSCQQAARTTAANIERFGLNEVEASRGESAYLIEMPDRYLAHVEEGLGTKNLVADEMYRLTGKSYYGCVAQDTVAMIVNDLVTLGALPLSVAMHLAVGDSKWFDDARRSDDLIFGWKHACDLSRCTWGGGETPTLKGVVTPGTVVLSGSAIGMIFPKSRLIRSNIRAGDAIVVVESSGIHANGLTLAREIAGKLPEGYLTKLSDGCTYGESLLKPTLIYVPLVEDLMDAGVNIRYAINVTGHGWRKLMRAPQPFAYVIERLPKPFPLFEMMQACGPISDAEAYGNLNMGAGFALIVPPEDAETVTRIASTYPPPNGMHAFEAGHVECSDTRKVVIRPKGLEYRAETLEIR